MDPADTVHVVALPYPGRGHINPMMNFCKQLALKQPEIVITFVVTEEWLGFIGSDSKPDNIKFGTIPNVLPSELVRGKDVGGFAKAVQAHTEAPLEELLDRIDCPVTVIVADTYFAYIPALGKRRNIPVASLWTMSASMFSLLHHFPVLREKGHFPCDLPERRDEIVDYIPGISPTRVADLPPINRREVIDLAAKCVGEVSKAKYLLFTSVYEVETQVLDALQADFPFPVYSIGPSIPYMQLNQTSTLNDQSYLQWLDLQPAGSVLYVSMGSFLSVSDTQMEEIFAGVRDSGVRFLFIARGKSVDLFKDECGETGIVLPWCDQLRVLSHSSIGGFWSHCGFNSTLEALYTGVPLLTFPIVWDQMLNSKVIAEDWKIGWRAQTGSETLVSRGKISEIVKRFMDSNSGQRKDMQTRAMELHKICRAATSPGGSSYTNLDCFVQDLILKSHHNKST